MKTIISESERGLKFKNGKFQKLLLPGKYITFGDTEIEKMSVEAGVCTHLSTLSALLENKGFREAVTTVDVEENKLALHYVDGVFIGVLRTGKYAFWKALGEHNFTFADISTPEVAPDIPEYIFSRIPAYFYTKAEVDEHQKARVYYNKKLVKILDTGTYYFWKNDKKVDISLVDTRLISLEISGQEMLTQDKVTLRINFVCNYRISDYVKIVTEINNYEEQLHTAAQLALRDYIGRYKLDEILENKSAISKVVFEKLKERERELFITVHGADVKDIILPGEIRDIMNTVLVAEKKAQANVITRREEVASTRSLLNTAKLMEENPTLYKLKELEYVERICENVGNINVTGSGDLVTQLAGILRGASK